MNATPTTCPECGHSATHSPVMGCLQSDRREFCSCTRAWTPPKTIEQAREERDAAMESVDANADTTWKAEALKAIKYLAARGPQFTTDDVWERLEYATSLVPHDPRALGPIMRAAAKDGLIVGHGWTPSRRRHSSPIRTYTGPAA